MKKSILIIINLYFVLASAQENREETAIEFQDNLNKQYADSISSPLKKEDLLVFKKLNFYDIDSNFIVKARFVRTKKEKVFKMKTTTTRLPIYKKYGELYFSLNSKEFVLNVYQNIDLSKNKEYKHYLFLPFTDLTCANESYAGGRYIDMQIPNGNIVIINFNKAYNPYCAYNYKYSCPIVPSENNLSVAIYAGVKKFED